MLTPFRIKASTVSLLVLACLTAGVLGASAERRVLVYTKNQIGKGLYVHDNIPASVAALKKLGEENNIAVDVSDGPAVFTDQNLKRYKALVFDNTNNEIFDNEEQKAAFQRYIRGVKNIESPKGTEQRVALWGYASSGGGLVCIHSAIASMRQWPWFWSVSGGNFSRHARMQKFTIKVKDPKDPSTAHLPATFEWTDEFYYTDHIPAGLHVLLTGDLTTLNDPGKEKYPGKKFGDEFPLAWRHQFDGGREWTTTLGHKPEHYADPKLTRLILGGILWVMGETK